MEPAEKTVGIFVIRLLSPGRWQVTNTLTTFVHVTYGPEEEVSRVLKEQTTAWRAKFQQVGKHKGKSGSAWRTRNQAELAQIKASRANETS